LGGAIGVTPKQFLFRLGITISICTATIGLVLFAMGIDFETIADLLMVGFGAALVSMAASIIFAVWDGELG
jgi:hypothetical protein